MQKIIEGRSKSIYFVFFCETCVCFFCSSCGELQPEFEFYSVGFDVDLGKNPKRSLSLSVQNLYLKCDECLLNSSALQFHFSVVGSCCEMAELWGLCLVHVW